MQVFLKIVLQVVNIFCMLHLDNSFFILFIDGFDFEVRVRTEDEFFVVSEIWIENWIGLVGSVDLQLQLNSIWCDVFFAWLLLVFWLVKDTVVFVEDWRPQLAFLYQVGFYVMIKLNPTDKRISTHSNKVHVNIQHVLLETKNLLLTQWFHADQAFVYPQTHFVLWWKELHDSADHLPCTELLNLWNQLLKFAFRVTYF